MSLDMADCKHCKFVSKSMLARVDTHMYMLFVSELFIRAIEIRVVSNKCSRYDLILGCTGAGLSGFVVMDHRSC